jgi:Uma2 family endonuclease
MNMIPPRVPEPDVIVYPDRDGKPMADNTKQFRWIQTIEGNLEALFRDRADVFVAGDNLWYPVEGEPETRQAPDVYVVFGRPKGDRGSYQQWKESDVPLTVVFEILSPSNTRREIADKLAFYDEHGVEEYYVYDPDDNELLVYVRGKAALRRIWKVDQHVSPRLGIRFDLSGEEMVIYRPDGKPFLSFEAVEAAREQAEQSADQATQRAEQAERRTARLAELGRKARQQQITAEELAELERLEAEVLPPPAP